PPAPPAAPSARPAPPAARPGTHPAALLAAIVAGAVATVGLWWFDTPSVSGFGDWLTDAAVTAVDYPQNNQRDIEINQFAIPQLNQEATAARSATIDTVSGATVTSDGYIQSLQSARDKAGL
ncbi:MAG TPA: FMN-binding protein, partial [Mycobacteriales bacterium]